MAFVRILSTLLKDKALGRAGRADCPRRGAHLWYGGHVSAAGHLFLGRQRYTPHDAGGILYYKEDDQGQILEEGINEAGAFSAWLAAATSYSVSDFPMVPFYIFYSMFGFQRIGDLAWAAGDSQARGFLIGATAGRTTLNGEGLAASGWSQPLDWPQPFPTACSYDPAYAYELAVIIQDGMRRMYEEGENCFYYITTMNENYHQPEMPEGVEEGIIKGIYKKEQRKSKHSLTVQLLGAGAILREVEAAAEMLERDYGVAADVWSITSVNELAREGKDCHRWNMLHPTETPRESYLTQQLKQAQGPFIAATDYMKAHTDQLREFIPGRFTVLGTDGFGRSDTRAKLRKHFEVNRDFVVLAALKALADEGQLKPQVVLDAIKALGIDAEKSNPRLA